MVFSESMFLQGMMMVWFVEPMEYGGGSGVHVFEKSWGLQVHRLALDEVPSHDCRGLSFLLAAAENISSDDADSA